MANQPQANSQHAQNSKSSPKGSEHPVADQLRETLHNSVDAVSEKSAALEQNLRRSAASSSEAMAEKRAELESRWERSSIKRYAVENPVATAGIAFAAGALLTSLFRKK